MNIVSMLRPLLRPFWPAFLVLVSHLAYGAYKTSPARDNSEINQRDQIPAAVTADQQALGSKKDVETTRRIRRALTRDQALSIYAQNIKIITLNGKVTLRGPVHTDEEKARVVSIARKVAGDSRIVRNELEIKR